MYDIIEKKRDGGGLTKGGIEFFIRGYVSGDTPGYQAFTFLMAIYFKGMTEKETATLTMSTASSGGIVDLSSVPGIRVDKHSTGGVEDKTTLVISPVVASLGVPVAKMNGRGLGHTEGTVDKMESISSMQTFLDHERFFNIVHKVGVSVIGQSGNLVPADKKLYALHDIAATVDSIPLIVSSVMSKKIATGSDCILLGVRGGSGAFTKTVNDSIRLTKMMVSVDEHVGRRTVALIANMNHPLGNVIGNSLGICEVCNILKGHGPTDLTAICIKPAVNMLYLTGKGSTEECERMAQGQLHNGEAYEHLKEMVTARGGNIAVLDGNNKFQQAKVRHEVYAQRDSRFHAMDTEKCGIASVELGAGREKRDSPIDHSAGIILKKKAGDKMQEGEPLAVLCTSDPSRCTQAGRLLESATTIRDGAPEEAPLIYAHVTRGGMERY